MTEVEKHTPLLPCPFCGSAFLMGQEPHDNHPVGGQFYIYHDYGPLGSAARRCFLDVRKHFETSSGAAAEWNDRPVFEEMRDALQASVDHFANNVREREPIPAWLGKAVEALSKVTQE